MDLKRREFLKIVGAATVATGLPGCTPKEPKSLIPYVIPEEEIIPGRSVWYASVCRECPAGCGVSIRVREGRATKAEGNPLHPVNGGALCARGQASLQGLYNPDRIQTPLLRTAAGGWEPLSWEKAQEYLVSRLRDVMVQRKGKQVVFITPHVTGSIDALVDQWLGAIGSTNRYRYEPFAYETIRRANEQTFGRNEIPTYDFEGVDTLYSFGTDFLETWLSPVEFARSLSRMRGEKEGRNRSRCTYLGPRLSMTAANADHWVNVHPDMLGNLALSMVHVILARGMSRTSAVDANRLSALVKDHAPDQMSWPTGLTVDRITELALAFGSSPSSLAVAGGPVVDGEFGAQTCVAVNLLNYVVGSVGRSIRFGPSSSMSQLSTYADMERLVRQMEADQVSALFVTEANPVFAMPPASGIAAGIRKVPFVVACSSVMDETTALATLVLPIHTALESWGDYEPSEGIRGLMQPVMQPVFKTRMLGDILLDTGRKLGARTAFPAADFRLYVKDRWRAIHARRGREGSFESFWVEALARGGVWEPAVARPVKLAPSLSRQDAAGPRETPPRGGSAFTLMTYPSIAHFDGRGANKPWLQELPDPMTRLVWGSWLEINPDDAARLGIENGDRIQVTSPYGRHELPAHVYRGLRAGCVAIPIGQGHTAYGRYATDAGVNVMALLDPKPSSDLSGGVVWFGTNVEVLKLPGPMPIASVQEAESQQDRGIIQSVALSELEAGRDGVEQVEPSLYPEQEYPAHRWGLVIDLDKCTGCSACVTACYAENNIPVVGREEVMSGREMAWIRIDRYFEDHTDGARAQFLPMLCQQCGSAPCETVCPVYAAYHTEEGLNGQVYNRCIGTRYCANNCPYKVRRFNWFDHSVPEPLNWQLNPDVTVRSKGVMEKCTFCIQRIVEAKNSARIEHRPVRDGDITTACQQSCPARAIIFGDLKDPESAVSREAAAHRPRPYHVLHELNTLPAVTYLKRIVT